MKNNSLKIQKKLQKRKNKGTIPVYVKNDCGCCFTEMRFRSAESAEDAFKKIGLNNSATIIDDKGIEYTGIDTFYGFCLKKPINDD